MRCFFPLVGLLLLVGCGGNPPAGHVEPTKLTALPEPVMKAAKEAMPGAKINRAWKGPDENYSVRGKTKSGETKTVRVTPAGQVLKSE